MKITADDNADHVESVEIRHKPTEIFGVASIFCIIGVIALVKPNLLHPNEGSFAVALRCLGFVMIICGIVAGYSLGKSKIVADAKGIKWPVNKDRNELDWRQITAIQVREEGNPDGWFYYVDLLFSGLEGEPIGSLRLVFGSVKERQRFVKFVTQQVEVMREGK